MMRKFLTVRRLIPAASMAAFRPMSSASSSNMFGGMKRCNPAVASPATTVLSTAGLVSSIADVQRRFAFYDSVAVDDPFFDCVRSSDIYGIVCVMNRQLDDLMKHECVRTTPPHTIAAITGETLFSGIIAINAVLRNDVIPVRLPHKMHSEPHAPTDTHLRVSGEVPPAQIIFEPHRGTDPMDFHPLTLRKLARTVIDLATRCCWHSAGADYADPSNKSGLPQLYPRWNCPSRQQELIDAWAQQHVSDNDGDEVPNAERRRLAAIAFNDLAAAMHDFNGLLNLLAAESTGDKKPLRSETTKPKKEHKTESTAKAH